MRIESYQPHFVDLIPDYDDLEDDGLYISIMCHVAIHKCACGCGMKVSTTISPNRWRLIYDGKTVTLSPSIGNFSFPCRSHYFIRENKVVWVDEHRQPSKMQKEKRRKWFQFLFIK